MDTPNAHNARLSRSPQRGEPSVQDSTHPPGSALHHIGYAANSNNNNNSNNVVSVDSSKAGMEKIDKERVNAIINEASKGTPFYINEQRKAQARQQRVAKLQEKSRVFAALGKDALRELRTRVVTLEEQLESGRSLRLFIHLDMDMFYAAVEEKMNPTLRTVPFGVGSMGMLSTTNYVARQFGVRAGMPGFLGLKLCPTLVIVPVNFPAYRKVAEVVRGIAKDYDPDYASLGLDELTMDVNAYLVAHPGMTAADVAREVRERIVTATGLTASCGIAPTAVLAKMASNYEKPNGQHELVLKTREEVIAYMRPLEVRQVPGIGRATTDVLNGLGIRTCGELYDDRVRMAFLFTHKSYVWLLSCSMGLMSSWAESGEETDETESRRKSCGNDRTFGPLKSRGALQEVANGCLESALRRMRRLSCVAKQVVLRLKHTSYIVKQHSHTMPFPTDNADVLRRAVDTLLLPQLDHYAQFRLLGVRLCGISPKPRKHGKRARSNDAAGGVDSSDENIGKGDEADSDGESNASGCDADPAQSTQSSDEVQPTLNHFFKLARKAKTKMEHSNQRASSVRSESVDVDEDDGHESDCVIDIDDDDVLTAFIDELSQDDDDDDVRTVSTPAAPASTRFTSAIPPALSTVPPPAARKDDNVKPRPPPRTCTSPPLGNSSSVDVDALSPEERHRSSEAICVDAESFESVENKDDDVVIL